MKSKSGRALVERVLTDQSNACYVLITCAEPSEEGQMEVEMTYEGDHDLASYLIDSAQSFLQEPFSLAE